MAVILLVDDNDNLRQVGRDYLTPVGHSVVSVGTAAEGLQTLREVQPDLIIFNTNVHDMAPDEFHRWLRTDLQNEVTPVIYLVPIGIHESFQAALRARDLGHSIAVAKPFRWQALEEIIGATLAGPRQGTGFSDALDSGDLQLDSDSYELRGEMGSVVLTPMELRLTKYLMRRINRIVSTEELLELVWGYHPHTGSPDVVRSHIRNLRRKLLGITDRQDVIQTVPWRGYRLVSPTITAKARPMPRFWGAQFSHPTALNPVQAWPFQPN